MGEKLKRHNSKHETSKHIYDFQQFKTIRSWGENIISVKFTINQADEDQNSLLENIVEFNDKSRPRTKESNILVSNKVFSGE